jgi:hypothetical protein
MLTFKLLNTEISVKLVNNLFKKELLKFPAFKVIVGSPTQQCRPAPSVTSERGTVLVNFVGFDNRFLFYLEEECSSVICIQQGHALSQASA